MIGFVDFHQLTAMGGEDALCFQAESWNNVFQHAVFLDKQYRLDDRLASLLSYLISPDPLRYLDEVYSLMALRMVSSEVVKPFPAVELFGTHAQEIQANYYTYTLSSNTLFST